MNDEASGAGLLRAIAERPDDAVALLARADWLEDAAAAGQADLARLDAAFLRGAARLFRRRRDLLDALLSAGES